MFTTPSRRSSSGKKRATVDVRHFAGPKNHTQRLDGIRIALLTDQHVGRITPLSVQMHAVELANRSESDLVVLTGDFVCHGQGYLDQLQEVVEAFDAPVMAVLGNHDHWSGAKEVRSVLRRAGAEVLDNAHTTITLRHQRLQVVGLDDAYTGHADRDKALKGLRPGLATIGLSHIAEEADALWHHGVPIVYSGHTHAGQVTLARLHELAVGRIAGHKYIHGLYGSREADSAVYVGAGIGAAVMPVRLRERGQREVAIFELGAEHDDFDDHHVEQPSHPGRKPSPRTKARRKDSVAKKNRRRERRSARKRRTERNDET